MSVYSLCHWCSILAKGKVQPLFSCQLYHLVYRGNVYIQPLLLVFPIGQRKSTAFVLLLAVQLYYLVYRGNVYKLLLLLVFHIGQRKSTAFVLFSAVPSGLLGKYLHRLFLAFHIGQRKNTAFVLLPAVPSAL